MAIDLKFVVPTPPSPTLSTTSAVRFILITAAAVNKIEIFL